MPTLCINGIGYCWFSGDSPKVLLADGRVKVLTVRGNVPWWDPATNIDVDEEEAKAVVANAQAIANGKPTIAMPAVAQKLGETNSEELAAKTGDYTGLPMAPDALLSSKDAPNQGGNASGSSVPEPRGDVSSETRSGSEDKASRIEVEKVS